MAVLEIVEYPAQVLKQTGAPVEKFDAELEKLVAEMFETMYAAEGVGLAAPQVGLSLRLFVMDCEEGCLSVGKIHAPLRRAARVRLRAQDARGEVFEREAEGLAARCFQHE